MKKLLTIVCAFAISVGSMAFTPIAEKPTGKKSAPKASELMIPIGSQGKKISMLELSTISRAELEKVTGKKMNFLQRMAFKGAQKKMRNAINEDGVVTDKKMQKMFGSADGESGFHLGGFALGFLVGLIGVLIAYLLNDDKKRNRVKWAWLGLAAAFVLSIALILAVL